MLSSKTIENRLSVSPLDLRLTTPPGLHSRLTAKAKPCFRNQSQLFQLLLKSIVTFLLSVLSQMLKNIGVNSTTML